MLIFFFFFAWKFYAKKKLIIFNRLLVSTSILSLCGKGSLKFVITLREKVRAKLIRSSANKNHNTKTYHTHFTEKPSLRTQSGKQTFIDTILYNIHIIFVAWDFINVYCVFEFKVLSWRLRYFEIFAVFCLSKVCRLCLYYHALIMIICTYLWSYYY